MAVSGLLLDLVEPFPLPPFVSSRGPILSGHNGMLLDQRGGVFQNIYLCLKPAAVPSTNLRLRRPCAPGAGGVYTPVSYDRVSSETNFVIDTTQGLVTRFRTASESTASTDTADFLFTAIRTAMEAGVVLDTAERQVAFVRSLTESLGLTDTADRNANHTRRTADATGLADTAQRQVDFARLGAEATALADSAARTTSLTRTTTEVTDETDLAYYALVLSRIASDTLPAMIDTASFSMDYSRVAEEHGMQDFSNIQGAYSYRVVAYSRTLYEAVTAMADSARSEKVQHRTSTEGQTEVELAARQATYRPVATDATPMQDEARRSATYMREPVIFAATRTDDFARRVVIYNRINNQIDNQIDNALSLYTARRRSSEFIDLVDTASRSVMTSRVASELERQTDAARRVAAVSRFSGEVMADVGARGVRTVGYSRVTYDAVTELTDAAIRFALFPRRTSEAVLMSEVASRTAAVSRRTRDGFALLDSARRSSAHTRLGAESVPTDDTATRALVAVRLGTEVFGVVGSAARSALFNRLATEITSTDLMTARQVTATRWTADAVTTLDSTSHLLVVQRTAYDVLPAMPDTAIRVRIYLLPHAPFPEPYDMTLGAHAPYLLRMKARRVMEITLASGVTLVLDTQMDPAYDLTQGVHQFVDLDTDTTE